MTTADTARAAADLIWQHWHAGTVMPQLPAELRPATRPDGYAIQSLLAMKGQLATSELAACDLPAAVVKTIELVVPGYAERHLLVIEAAGAASEHSAFVA